MLKFLLENKGADRHAFCRHLCQQKIVLPTDSLLAACVSVP